MTKKPHWQTSPNTFLSAILRAATSHGNDDDPDHEVGDLQDLVWELWNAMPLQARLVFMSSEKWNSFIALWGCALTRTRPTLVELLGKRAK